MSVTPPPALAADAAARNRARPAFQEVTAARVGAAPEPVGFDAQSAPASHREHAHTEFGGLMYLLWLIEPSGVLEAVNGEGALAQRGLRWTLRQMALQLLPLDADDAVLRAFSGGSREAAQSAEPDRKAEQATPAEAADIAVLTGRLESLLRARLDEPTRAREHLLEIVCRRGAAIHFEAGWIELHFELATASTAIRRGGLDRDLGWLPWLGAVVKFAYV